MKQVFMTCTIVLVVSLFGCSKSNNRFTVNNTMLPVIKKKRNIQLKRVEFGNKYLRLSVIPSLMGSVENITFLPNGKKLFWGLDLKEETTGPLLSRMVGGGCGFIERYWALKGIDNALMPMQVVKISENEIELFAKNYGFLSASLHRRITVEPGTLFMSIEAKLSSNYSFGVINARPWIDLVPAGGRIKRAIPARSGSGKTGIGGCTVLPRSGIYSKSSGPQNFFPPARNWVAAVLPEKIALVIITEPAPVEDCTIYLWNGELNHKPAKTVEYILPGKKLRKGDTFSYRYRLGVFPGLEDVKDICGDTALDCRIEGSKLYLILCPGRKFEERNVALTLKTTGKPPVELGSRRLKAMFPGNTTELVFRLPGELAKGEWKISGKLGDHSFKLLDPIINVNN